MNKTLMAVAIGAIFGIGGAQAGTVKSLIVNGPNQASDENREYMIDRNLGVVGDWDGDPGTPDAAAVVGQLDVGDSLRGSINFNTMNSASANVGGLTPNNEMTAIFQTLVTGKTRVPDGFGGFTYSYIFGPDPSFAEAVAYDAANATAHAGSAIAFVYDDASKNYAGDYDDPDAALIAGLVHDDGAPHPLVGSHTPPSSADVSVGPYLDEEAFIATAGDGSLMWILGWNGSPGEGWFAPGGLSDNLMSLFGITSSGSLLTANFSLNVLERGPGADGVTINPITCGIFGLAGDFCGSTNVRGVSDLDTPFEASSNTQISFDATVPEPATLGLLGLGLLGMGAMLRRRRS